MCNAPDPPAQDLSPPSQAKMDALLPHLVQHWTHHRVTGARRPLLAGLKLTHRCNLHCRTCPFWRRPRPDLAYDAVRAALDELYRAGCRLLILEGGEPFLWRDGERGLEDVIATARSLGFARVGITTNGTLPIQTTADIVWVSVDGMKAAHEANRGPIWDTVMANVSASSHRRLFAQVTITRENWQDLSELVRFLAGRVAGVTIQFFYPFAESDDLWLPLKERSFVLQQLMALKRAGYPVTDSYRVLRALEDNSWTCHDWLIADAEPATDDSSRAVVHYGCYLKGRADVDCRRCGFAAHAELSQAYDLRPGALRTGARVFGF